MTRRRIARTRECRWQHGARANRSSFWRFQLPTRGRVDERSQDRSLCLGFFRSWRSNSSRRLPSPFSPDFEPVDPGDGDDEQVETKSEFFVLECRGHQFDVPQVLGHAYMPIRLIFSEPRVQLPGNIDERGPGRPIVFPDRGSLRRLNRQGHPSSPGMGRSAQYLRISSGYFEIVWPSFSMVMTSTSL